MQTQNQLFGIRIIYENNYHELKCFYCKRKIQKQDTEKLPSSPIYKALYEKFVKAGHITPKDKTTDFTNIVENQDNDDAEETSIRKSKFLYLLKMKPKKSVIRIGIPKS